MQQPQTAATTAGTTASGATISAVETRFVRLPLAFAYGGGRGAAGGRRGGPSAGQHPGWVIILLRPAAGLPGMGDVIVRGGAPRLGRGAAAYVESLLAPAL